MRPWLITLFVLGLAPRALILALNRADLQVWEYDTLGQNIAAGHGYSIARFAHTAYAFGDGNLYSFLSAAVYSAFGHRLLALAMVTAVIGSLAAPLIFAVGRRALDWRVAALGATLAALHPGLLAYTTKLHPLELDVLLMSATVLWIQCGATNTRGRVMVGFALGMSAMSRPTFFVSSGLALAVRLLRARRGPVAVLLPAVIALCVMAPWVARNWAVLRRPVFISTSLEDVWKGNNPSASGASYLPGGSDVLSSAPIALQTRLNNASELEVNDVFGTEIVTFITRHPTDFVALTGRKFGYFWWFSPEAGILYPQRWLLLYQLYYAAAAIFALVGIIAIVRGGEQSERTLLTSLVVIALTLAVIHSLSYVEGRHRWGIEPLLLLLSARGIFVVTRRARPAVHNLGARTPASAVGD